MTAEQVSCAQPGLEQHLDLGFPAPEPTLFPELSVGFPTATTAGSTTLLSPVASASAIVAVLSIVLVAIVVEESPATVVMLSIVPVTMAVEESPAAVVGLTASVASVTAAMTAVTLVAIVSSRMLSATRALELVVVPSL